MVHEELSKLSINKPPTTSWGTVSPKSYVCCNGLVAGRADDGKFTYMPTGRLCIASSTWRNSPYSVGSGAVAQLSTIYTRLEVDEQKLRDIKSDVHDYYFLNLTTGSYAT